MERGDVCLTSVDLPNRPSGVGTAPRRKYVVVLRGGPGSTGEPDVPVAVASTNRRPAGRAKRAFEVDVGVAEGFQHETVIDCRWPYTMQKSDLSNPAFRLSAAKMQEVSIALVSGLQMFPPSPSATALGEPGVVT